MTSGRSFPGRALRRPALAALLLCACAPLMAADYHISYLWHPDFSRVAGYKDKIAGLLGPDVARRLSVVRGKDNFGLVYARRGGLDSARDVAAAHSRILAAKGLEQAVPIPAAEWAPPLPAVSAPPLPARAMRIESEIENYIKDLRRRGTIKADERTAWTVYDFSSGEKLVSINEDLPLEAASLIKPFIALAWLHEAGKGRKPYGTEEQRRMEDMIKNSDNVSASWFMRRLGGPARLQQLLRSNYGAIFQDTSIVEYIPANGRTFRNRASAHDYSRFLYALWKDEIPGSAEIKRLMNLPNPDRLYTAAPGVPAGTEVYDKTGTTSRLCGDMGILVAKRADGESFPYIIVGVIEKGRSTRRYSSWMRSRGDIIRRVSEIVYEGITDLYRFDSAGALSAEKNGGTQAKQENASS
ncbi:MAG: serine hydrolase [Elusimicrobiales bacterium]